MASSHEEDNAFARLLTRVRGAREPVDPSVIEVAEAVGRLMARAVVAEKDRAMNDALAQADAAIARGDLQSAHEAHERAFRACTTNPQALARYGLTLILVKHDRQRGMRFCEEAVRTGPAEGDVELLLALARAGIACRSRVTAAKALERARRLAPNDERISIEAAKIGIRREPVLRFLSRRSVLNRWLGAVRTLFVRERSFARPPPALPPAP